MDRKHIEKNLPLESMQSTCDTFPMMCFTISDLSNNIAAQKRYSRTHTITHKKISPMNLSNVKSSHRVMLFHAADGRVRCLFNHDSSQPFNGSEESARKRRGIGNLKFHNDGNISSSKWELLCHTTNMSLQAHVINPTRDHFLARISQQQQQLLTINKN